MSGPKSLRGCPAFGFGLEGLGGVGATTGDSIVNYCSPRACLGLGLAGDEVGQECASKCRL